MFRVVVLILLSALQGTFCKLSCSDPYNPNAVNLQLLLPNAPAVPVPIFEPIMLPAPPPLPKLKPLPQPPKLNPSLRGYYEAGLPPSSVVPPPKSLLLDRALMGLPLAPQIRVCPCGCGSLL